MKRLLRQVLYGVGILLLIAVGALIYSFTPQVLPDDPAQAVGIGRGRRDPAALPEVKLSLIKAGKMPARQAFTYRGGSWSAGYENGMAAVLVRHPEATILFDTGFGSKVDDHWKTIPKLMRSMSSYVKETPVYRQLEENGI
ncbi:MAG: hypothetical protein ABI882_03605, partial [Acidobacteriota bacterium]